MSTRNLIIFCDGTWNDTENMDGGEYAPTNVLQFYKALAKVGDKQRSYYEDGVGTRPMEALPGGIAGYGLDKRILGAYRWLSKKLGSTNWEPEQNKIFVLGFSRGAYTARRIAGLVDFCGIATDPNDDELALELYKNREKNETKHFKNSGRFLKAPIEMVGVWDTVKTTLDPDFNDNLLGANVVAGYHAMAIDEKRGPFKVLKWKKDPRVLQKWFAGVHCDVGGGYKETGLADCAFMWMVYRAYSHGVMFDADVMTNRPDPKPKGKMHNSFRGIWKALPKKVRTINKGDLIDITVKTRLTLASYNPENLPDDPKFTSDDD